MKVYKSSKITILRPEILSVTLGLFWAIFVFIITLIAIVTRQSWTLINLFEGIYPWYRPNWLGLILGLLWGFVNGFLLGFFIGWIYNWLIRKKVKKARVPIFDFDPKATVNIIQQGIGDNPYTIAIVANPVLIKKDETLDYDPIIQEDKDLFVKVVIRILRSFLNNELTRKPEIFSRLKIITIFDENSEKLDQNALCYESPGTITLAPRKATQDGAGIHSIPYEYIKSFDVDADVIFIISASQTHSQSSARFAVENAALDGEGFEFTFTDDLTDAGMQPGTHTYYSDLPGIIALSAWDDRLKTPVHEFAHAMSSIKNGAIVDEYVDRFHDSTENRLQDNMINRKIRTSFKITNESLNDMESDGVPSDVTDKLRDIINQEVRGKSKFLNIVKDKIGDEAVFEMHQSKILKHADQASFMITERALENIRAEGLVEDVLWALKTIQDQLVRGEEKFIELLRTTIGDSLTRLHKYSILIHARYSSEPVPDIFARYKPGDGETVEYFSDRIRTDKKHGWISYVPERIGAGISCIMDIAYFGYRFDKLIFDFMYDRLMAKLSR